MYIGIDIGGTHTRVWGFDSLDNPKLGYYKKRKTNKNYLAALTEIHVWIEEVADREMIEGIGVAIAGELDDTNGQLVTSPNLQSWVNKALKYDLQGVFDCPIVLENDLVAAATGEVVFGNAKKDFLFVAWGTGIGGASVHFVGNTPFITATELGHQVVVANGRICPCGGRGCLEVYCRGGGLKSVKYMTQGLINSVVINPVQTIIMGGGVAEHESETMEHVKSLAERSLKILPFPEIKSPTFAEKFGVYGALSLLRSTV